MKARAQGRVAEDTLALGAPQSNARVSQVDELWRDQFEGHFAHFDRQNNCKEDWVAWARNLPEGKNFRMASMAVANRQKHPLDDRSREVMAHMHMMLARQDRQALREARYTHITNWEHLEYMGLQEGRRLKLYSERSKGVRPITLRWMDTKGKKLVTSICIPAGVQRLIGYKEPLHIHFLPGEDCLNSGIWQFIKSVFAKTLKI